MTKYRFPRKLLRYQLVPIYPAILTLILIALKLTVWTSLSWWVVFSLYVLTLGPAILFAALWLSCFVVGHAFGLGVRASAKPW